MNTKTYTYYFTLTCCTGIILLLGFNWFLNPFAITKSPVINGVNDQKTGEPYTRAFKVLEIDEKKTKTIIMGSSRGAVYDVETISKFVPPPVQNTSISALRVKEFNDFLTYMTHATNVEHIIYLPDFFGFNTLFPYDANYIQGSVGKSGRIKMWALALISLQATQESWNTLTKSVANQSKIGKEPPAKQQENKTAEKEGLQKKFEDQVAKYWKNPKLYKTFSLDTQSITALQDSIKTFKKKRGGGITIIIGPSHAWQWQAIDLAGLWPQFEEWKRQLSNIALETDVELWDFSGFTPYTTIPIANAQDWYDDSSHYSKKYVPLILSCVYKQPTCPQNLGKKISPKNIEEHLKTIKKDQQTFISGNRRAIEKLQSIHESIK